MTAWPFQDPPDVVVITVKQIVFDGDWIAHVSHDADDGMWQFHTSDPSPPREEDAAVVCLREIVRLDPSIADLADLPPGWRAWRDSKDSPWKRGRRETR